jgi:formylmethanofuran dehydrogenase subunit C
MSALTFTARANLPAQRLDLSGLVPQLLANGSVQEILRLPLWAGREQQPLGEFFTVVGSDVSQLVVEGSISRLDGLGAGLKADMNLRVLGDVGAYLGQGMTGGTITVDGNAGIFAGSRMKGGVLNISGNAGDFVGGTIAGDMQGMNGGLIHIRGNAGDRAADGLRRGMVVVEGTVGAYACSRMKAGTLVALQGTGHYAGYGMKRGTLLTRQLASVPVTFKDGGEQSLGVMVLLLRELKKLGGALAQLPHDPPALRRYLGDVANGGLGEILLLPR